MKKSWRTTAAGITAFVAALATQLGHAFAGEPTDWNLVVTAGALMIGLFMARDNNVSSEEAGAK